MAAAAATPTAQKRKRAPRAAVGPSCPYCGQAARLEAGLGESVWFCSPCGAAAPDKKGKIVGRMANLATRNARSRLMADMIAPMIHSSHRAVDYEPESPQAQAMIHNAAKRRIWQYLAAELNLSPEECGVEFFDIDTCRRAWAALVDVDYGIIRMWAKEREKR